MTQWEEFKFEERIREILRDTVYVRQDHHFRRPFLTAYQLAIEFAKRHPDDFSKIGYPVGGRGTGERSSLAQYIARELSRNIRDKKLPDIEGGFVSNNHLGEISFRHEGKQIVSSLTDSDYDLSMFRLT